MIQRVFVVDTNIVVAGLIRSFYITALRRNAKIASLLSTLSVSNESSSGRETVISYALAQTYIYSVRL